MDNVIPYTHWSYFADHQAAERCAAALAAAGYLTALDPPGYDPWADGEVRPVEPDPDRWLLRAAGPLDLDQDLDQEPVERAVVAHGGRYDGGESGWLPIPPGLARAIEQDLEPPEPER